MKQVKKGFTLIELVVVMAIIAILSVIIVGAILAARTAATNTQRTGAVRTIETALEARAARCSGMYFSDQSATRGTSCGTVTTGAAGTAANNANLQTLITSLSAPAAGYLNDSVVLGDPVAFTLTVGTVGGSVTANNYRIQALDDHAQVLYTATR